jgi:predicted RNase H-like nuclease
VGEDGANAGAAGGFAEGLSQSVLSGKKAMERTGRTTWVLRLASLLPLPFRDAMTTMTYHDCMSLRAVAQEDIITTYYNQPRQTWFPHKYPKIRAWLRA